MQEKDWKTNIVELYKERFKNFTGKPLTPYQVKKLKEHLEKMVNSQQKMRGK